MGREIGYLTRHSKVGQFWYDFFRFRRAPAGSGAIESTIRWVIKLRLKGNRTYWTEENAEAVLQLRAAAVSGRWEEIVTHTRDEWHLIDERNGTGRYRNAWPSWDRWEKGTR
jgi:hypothetical protein